MASHETTPWFTNLPLLETITYLCEFIEMSGIAVDIPLT